MRRLLFFLVLMLTPSVCFAQASVRTLAGVNAQTGTSYTITAVDQTKLLTFNNVNPVAVTLPSPANTNFGVGAIFSVRNLGTGRVTITPTSSTIDNAATLILDQNQGADIYSDGTNYETQKGSGLGLFGAGAPTGSCVNGSNYTNTTNGNLWVCQAGTWVVVSGGGGGGSPSVGANGAVQISNGSGLFSSSGNVFDLNSLFQVNEDQQNAGPNPVGNDIRAFGGQSFNPNVPPGGAGITASCNGTTSITLSNASLFQNGGGISILGCGASNTLSTPSAPTVTTNLARVGTGTGDVTATGLTGTTTYNYKIAAQNLGSGITASSATGSVTTGPASLGPQTVNITSCARSNATVTCLTATHGLVVTAQMKIRGMSDNSFNVDTQVATVPDTTHFTYLGTVDTRTGATTSATGGTVVYTNLNHITWAAVTNAYRYIVCSDRGSPGTFNLIGISKPSYPGAPGTDGSLYFDDTGTTTSYPTPPWPIPSTCPTSASNNLLTTKIISGAGTTSIVVANSASQTLASTPARADNNVAIKAAAVANPSGSNVIIPAGNFTNYVTNSILDLSQISTGVTITALGQLQNWGDTIILGARSNIIGGTNPGGGASFSAGSYPEQLLFGAPGIHFIAVLGGQGLKRLQLDGQSNGQTNVVMDGGAPDEGYQLDDIACQTGGVTGVDDMSTCFRFRVQPGGSSNFVSKGRVSCVANQAETNSETPCLYDDSTGATVKIEEITLSGRGMLFQGNASGSQVNIISYYCQACNTPQITVAAPKNGGGSASFNLNLESGLLVNDTGSTPVVTALNSSGSIQLFLNTGFNSGGGTAAGYSGVPAQYTVNGGNGISNGQGFSSESVSSAVNGSGGAIDGIFNTFSPGAGAYATKQFNAALSTSNSYPIFVTGPVMTAPALALAAFVGGVPTGNQTYTVAPVWPNGGSGPNSLPATINVTTGNTQVNLTWTPLGATAGCTGYIIMRGNALANGGQVSGCGSSTFSDTSSFTVGQAPTVTSGGPSELTASQAAAPKIDLAANVTLGAQSGTAYTVNFPGNQPTSGNTFLSCTAANPSNCSWTAGGAGLPWNQISNPTGNLTLSMGSSNTSVFSYTSALANAFEWANTTAATVAISQSSPQLTLCGNAWTGVSSIDCLTFQHTPGNGVNAAITDTYGHTGASTGVVTSQFSGPVAAGPGTGAAGALILPQGTSNATSTAAITVQGATSITPYSIALPSTAPVSSNNFLSCSSATASLCTWQNGFGVGNGAAPVMGYYLSSNCPVISPDNFCFSTPGNTKIDTTCTWSNASTTVTCTDTPFVLADQGKQVGGWSSCVTDQANTAYGGAISTNTIVTISTFTDSNHVVLSATPANTQGTAGCFVWGNTDDTAAAAIDTALAAQSSFCPKVFLAAGQYLFNNPHFGAQPPGCASLGNLFGASTSFGNVDLPAAFELEGRGAGATVIHLGTGFPGTTSCNKYAYNGINACFALPPLASWRDLQISGDGQFNTCGTITTTNNTLITAVVAKIKDVLVTNFCGNASSGALNIGLTAQLLTQLDMFNSSGFGDIGIETTGSLVTARWTHVENSPTTALLVSGAGASNELGGADRWDFECFGCLFSQGTTAGANQFTNNRGIVTNKGVTRMYGTTIQQCITPTCTNNNNVALLASGVASSEFYGDGITIVGNNPGVTTNTIGVYCAGFSCKVSLRNSHIFNLPSGRAYDATAVGSTLIDGGNNVFQEPPTVAFAAGTGPGIIADGHSLMASCTGIATASQTLGIYGTGPNVTATTCTSTTIGSGIPFTQSRVVQGLYVTSSAAGVNASSGVVSVLKNGVATAITCTFGTNTFCFDATHTVTFNIGDLLSFNFTTQAAETLAGVRAFVLWE